MKKLIFSMLVLFLLLFTVTGVNAAQLYYNDAYHYYDAGEIGLSINGSRVGNLPMQPVIINGSTMVPVREAFEALGSKVTWNDSTCSAEISYNGVSVTVKIGDPNIIVNGKTYTIDASFPLPMLIGKDPSTLKTMVPVRVIAEKLGFVVGWDANARVVSLSNSSTTSSSFGTVSGRADSRYDYVYIATKTPVSPKITRYSNPERIVFDFQGVKFSGNGGSVNINGNSVAKVRYSNHDNYARLVLDVNGDVQSVILTDSNGIVIRSEKSPNKQLVYDGIAKRVYFDRNYVGNGKKVENGYSVTFSNLSMQDQYIEIRDSNIYDIIITNSAAGCTVTVDGSNSLSYTAEKGFYKSGSSIPPVNANPPSDGKPTVVIDAGHGGKDPGAVGYNSLGNAVAYETHINLSVALMVGEKLANNGVNVIYTRNKDEYITLQERADISNESQCNLFVSVHCNSIDDATISGTQVYYHPASEVGTKLAKNIYNKILELTPLPPKGTQNGAHLFVIRTTTSPAALVECAFISNESDRNYLLAKENQERIAEAIFQGIMQTLK